MSKLDEIIEHMIMGGDVVWNDPDPIIGNDYRITHIEDIYDDEEIYDLTPILIRYNGGKSEAEVYLSELIMVK